MSNAKQTMFPMPSNGSQWPVAMQSSVQPVLRPSVLPPRLTLVPHISVLPLPPARPTLPPGVRAARMMTTVRKVASGLARRLPRHVDIEDLVGAGSLGLADAFSRRGTMPGSEFEAFAVFRIRGAMLDELRRLDAMPRRSRLSAKRIALASRAVEQKLGRPAVDEEVAGELGLEINVYQALRTKIDASRGPVPFSALGREDEDVTLDVVDPRDEAPDTLAARSQIGQQITAKVNNLPERMRTVLMGIYVEGTTLKQIGRMLGVSESRVCQIHTEALAALRSTFSDETPRDDGEGERTAAPVSRIRIKSAAKAQEIAGASRTSKAS